MLQSVGFVAEQRWERDSNGVPIAKGESMPVESRAPSESFWIIGRIELEPKEISALGPRHIVRATVRTVDRGKELARLEIDWEEVKRAVNSVRESPYLTHKARLRV